MLISICIPHYNRVEYLVKVLDSIRSQTYQHIEVVISDDCSKDSSDIAIPAYVEKYSSTGTITYKYIRQAKNLGYDGNLRASLANGSGEYLFILGNDDALNGDHSIQKLVDHLEEFGSPSVTFCNAIEYGTGSNIHYRTNLTGVFGNGPDVAIQLFRCFSFVAGITYQREAFHRYNTSKHDGSVYFQMYLATKIIAAGGRVSAIKDALVAADVRVGSQKGNSYLDVLKERNSTFHEERGGLDRVFAVNLDGVLDHLGSNEVDAAIRKIYSQLYFFTYPSWLYLYRKEGVYRASVNLAIGCRPSILVEKRLSPVNLIHSWFIYSCMTIAGLLLPVSLVDRSRGFLRRRSKGFTYKSSNIE